MGSHRLECNVEAEAWVCSTFRGLRPSGRDGTGAASVAVIQALCPGSIFSSFRRSRMDGWIPVTSTGMTTGESGAAVEVPSRSCQRSQPACATL